MPNPNQYRPQVPSLPPMGKLGNFFQDNQAMMMALAGGLLANRQDASQPWFDARTMLGATALDREGRESRQTKNMTKDWLVRVKGLSEQDAEVAVSNPAIMNQMLAGGDDLISVGENSSLYNKGTGEWLQPPSAGAGGARYRGNSVEAQALNHLIESGMPPEQADQLAAGKIVTDPSTGALIFMTPQGIFSQADPQSPPQPITPNAPTGGQQPSAAMPGIQLTPGKPNKAKSQDQVKGEILVASAERDFQIANQLFDALGNRGDLAKGYGGKIGEFFQSPDYQVATDAVRNVIQSYIYAVSGAQAPEQEVNRNMQLVVPSVVDSPERVEAKRQRLAAMMEAIRVKARENTDDGLGGLGVEDLYQKYGLEP